MAKGAKKKSAKTRRPKRASYSAAVRALASVGVPRQAVGQLNQDGTYRIDEKKLEALKKKVGQGAWSKVRFVALNAPFKRRSPLSPA